VSYDEADAVRSVRPMGLKDADNIKLRVVLKINLSAVFYE